MAADIAPAHAATAGGIQPNTLVGGRFMVERQHHEDALAVTWLARDQKTNKPISIRVLGAPFAGDKDGFELVRNEVKKVAKLKHRSLLGTYGVGTHGGNAHFVACEWVQGTSLSDFVKERLTQGQHISLRGVYNVLAHVCKALSAVHTTSCHGALRPSVVYISRSGRVKVGDFGVSLALVNSGKWRSLPAEDQAFLAPEIRAGRPADAHSDIFGLGALLYVMMTGRSPMDDFVPPSHAHPEATPLVDQVLMRCLAGDPAQRFAGPEDVINALAPLVAEAPAAATNEFGVDLEIDVDVAASLAPPAPGGREPTGSMSIPVMVDEGSVPPPAPAHVQTLSMSRGSPLAPAVAPPPPMAMRAPTPVPAPVPTPAPSAGVDLQQLIAQLTLDDAPRWMAVKDGMDHGPFSARELVKLIVEGEITQDNQLLNMRTSERKPLAEYEEFREFVEQYKLRKAEKDFKVALDRSNKVEKRSNVAKFAVLTASVLVIVGGGLTYLQSRKAAEQRAATADVDMAALYESGQVKISGTAGILQFKRGAGGGKSRPGGGGGPGGMSYEDAMNQAMELGDATHGGGERQLTSADVAGVMNRKLNSLFGCVGQELRGGTKLGTVRIDLAILGSGKVAGASVHTGSAAFQSCIASKVRAIDFPPFPAPRMGARYSFDVD
jgi:serine/threonine protein kinase